MKYLLLLLLLATFTASAGEPRPASTILHLSPAQLDEFDATYWVTLTKEQQQLLRRRTGIAPTRLQIEYTNPDGERAELGYNIAIKTSETEIRVLHQFLLSDADAKKKRESDMRMIAASGPGTTKDIPTFAIDADGKLWRWISRQEFEAYVARDPKNIAMLYFQLPSSMPSKDTVAAADTFRQASKFVASKGVPFDPASIGKAQ